MGQIEKLVASKHVTTRQEPISSPVPFPWLGNEVGEEQQEPESAGLGFDKATREDASSPCTK